MLPATMITRIHATNLERRRIRRHTVPTPPAAYACRAVRLAQRRDRSASAHLRSSRSSSWSMVCAAESTASSGRNHAATAGPTRPGRILAVMIVSFGIDLSPSSGRRAPPLSLPFGQPRVMVAGRPVCRRGSRRRTGIVLHTAPVAVAVAGRQFAMPASGTQSMTRHPARNRLRPTLPPRRPGASVREPAPMLHSLLQRGAPSLAALGDSRRELQRPHCGLHDGPGLSPRWMRCLAGCCRPFIRRLTRG